MKRALNPALELEGIVLTMFDKRNNLSELVAADVRAFFGDKVYHHRHPAQCPHQRGAVARPAGHPLRPPLAGAQAYVDLAAELLKRERRARKSAA